MEKKYKTSKCLNCGEPCWPSAKVCGKCYTTVFNQNRKNKYDEFIYGVKRK